MLIGKKFFGWNLTLTQKSDSDLMMSPCLPADYYYRVSVPPLSAVIRRPKPALSSGQRYNLSCTASGWSPFVLLNWTLARPGAASPALVSLQSAFSLDKVLEILLVHDSNTGVEKILLMSHNAHCRYLPRSKG